MAEAVMLLDAGAAEKGYGVSDPTNPWACLRRILAIGACAA